MISKKSILWFYYSITAVTERAYYNSHVCFVTAAHNAKRFLCVFVLFLKRQEKILNLNLARFVLLSRFSLSLCVFNYRSFLFVFCLYERVKIVIIIDYFQWSMMSICDDIVGQFFVWPLENHLFIIYFGFFPSFRFLLYVISLASIFGWTMNTFLSDGLCNVWIQLGNDGVLIDSVNFRILRF